MPDAILFDLDGTLADTALDLGAALNRLRVEEGMEPLPLERLRAHTSNGVRGLLGVGMGLAPGQSAYPSMARRFLRHYEQALCVDTVLFDGITKLLDQLDAHGIAWGIVTNKPQQYTVPLVESLQLYRRAACVVSGDSSLRAKPSPVPLLMAGNLIGIRANRCAYVGDDLRDIDAARAAAMTSVAAAYGYLGDGPPIAKWCADHIAATPDAIAASLGIWGDTMPR